MTKDKKNPTEELQDELLEKVSGGSDETQGQPDSNKIPQSEETVPAIFMPILGRHENNQ